MQFNQLDEAEIIAAAKQTFENKFFSISTCDFYLRDFQDGVIHLAGVDHPLYVSTHYAYENHIVNGNPTRYKVELYTIMVKDDPYEIVYDSSDKYYIVYKNQDIGFIRYDLFHDFIKDYIKIDSDNNH